jgi:phosphoribosyl-AMP cyclohydrolase
MSNFLEESLIAAFDFNKLNSVVGQHVLPVVVQDASTKTVLVLAYVNAEALRLSLENKQAIFWSTSRQEIWFKGSQSGDVLSLVDVLVNCEQNSFVFLVKKEGQGVCHTKESGHTRQTCYYRSLESISSLRKLN